MKRGKEKKFPEYHNQGHRVFLQNVYSLFMNFLRLCDLPDLYNWPVKGSEDGKYKVWVQKFLKPKLLSFTLYPRSSDYE